jgi:hypothetical protein
VKVISKPQVPEPVKLLVLDVGAVFTLGTKQYVKLNVNQQLFSTPAADYSALDLSTYEVVMIEGTSLVTPHPQAALFLDVRYANG